MIQKVDFNCRFGFLIWFQFYFWQYVRFIWILYFCHGTFIRFSSFWFLSFFSWKKIQSNNWIHLKNDCLASISDSSQLYRGLMVFLYYFHGTFLLISELYWIYHRFILLLWFKKKCHEIAIKLFGALFNWKINLYDFFFFQTLKLSGIFIIFIWQIHSKFMALSWYIYGKFKDAQRGKCQENIIKMSQKKFKYNINIM